MLMSELGDKRDMKVPENIINGRNMAKNTYTNPQGIEVPRVTRITGQLDKPALMYWAVNCYHDYLIECLEGRNANFTPANKDYIGKAILRAMIDAGKHNFRSVSQDALDIGSLVHDLIHDYLVTGKEPGQNIDDRALSSFLAFLEFKEKHKMVTYGTEVTLFGDGYAGTCDWYGMFDGKRTIIDWKSSKAIYDEYRLQIAAYRRAFDMTPDRVKKLGGKIELSGMLRLDKLTGMPEWADVSDMHLQDEARFLLLKDFYIITEAQKVKKVKKAKK